MNGCLSDQTTVMIFRLGPTTSGATRIYSVYIFEIILDILDPTQGYSSTRLQISCKKFSSEIAVGS